MGKNYYLSNSRGTEINYSLTDHLDHEKVIIDNNRIVQKRNDYSLFGTKVIRCSKAYQDKYASKK